MLIDCPGCAKSYHIIKAALGPNGRRVACPRCDTIWFVAADGAAKSPETRELPNISAPIEISTVAVGAKSRVAGRAAPHRSPAQPALARTQRRCSPFMKELCGGAALLALAMAIIGFRADVVRLWPPSDTAYAALGMPVNLFGLELRNLRTVTTHDGGEAVLGIEGEIANVRPGETAVPPIELAIRDQDGHVLYSWTVASQKRLLAEGESILFQVRLAEPPAEGRDVLARFAPGAPERLASR